MPLDNIQLTEFSNDEGRQMGDLLTKLRIRIPAFVNEYFARDLTTTITAGGASELIVDGSATDGRTEVTGTNLMSLLSVVEAF